MTLFHDLLRGGAERHGSRTAVRFDDEYLSYEQLLTRSEGLAASLAEQGIGPTDHIALLMDNSLECVLAWFASSLTGCTEVPINPQYRGALLRYLLADSAASVVICDSAYLAQVLEVVEELPALRLVLVGGECGSSSGVTVAPLDFSGSGRTFEPPRQAPERVILYTSGTTGPSKGVVHTQKSCLVLARYNAEVMGYGPDDRLLNFFPLFHQNARYTALLPALCAGASIRIERRLSTSTFWQTCDTDGITAFNYLGSVLRMILNVTGPDRRAGSHSITRAFGAGASPAVWAEFEGRLGISLFETYGLSEAPMATMNVPGAGRSPFGSAGRAAMFDVEVVDGNDAPVPPDTVGEIVLRPRRADVMMVGYHNNEAATREALRGGWFHSGDRGHLSAQGDLYFEERAKDSLRRRGENISAWEVETTLEQHPAVAEAAVYGLPSADLDEEVAASIVPVCAAADLSEIFAFASAQLPAHAVPSLMRLVADLPRTATAKIKKDELRAVPRDQHLAMADAVKPKEAP